MLEKMRAVVFNGSKNVTVSTVDKPQVQHSRDAIIRVIAASICGSDLHMYQNTMKGMQSGDILGHECIGIVEEVGTTASEHLSVGQRVVVSAVLGCGNCDYCKQEKFSLCANTNDSKEQEKCLGGKTAGILGYSHWTGGWPGCQAQFVRVPNADVNCLPVSSELPDEKILFLSDLFPTSWHAAELGQIDSSSSVAIWGLGPVGLMTMVWARERGAKCIVGIDRVSSRLDKAKALGFQVLNYEECDILRMLADLIPEGPTVCIECVGFDYSKTWSHAIERTVRMETDSIDALSEAIYAVRKGGRVVVMGVFMGTANHFPIGALMEKGITLVGSQVYVQKYWNELYEKIKSLDTSFLVSHVLPLTEASTAYRKFNDKSDNAFKIVLKPWEN